MRLNRVALIGALALLSTTVVATPAHASSQTLFGTTVEVIAQYSGESLLGSTAHVPDGFGVLGVTLASPLPESLTTTLLVGATTIGSCGIAGGGTLCNLPTDTLPAGSNAVTVRFESDGMTQNYTGTLVGVTGASPTFRIEWQDTSGAWVNGSGTGLPLLGDTALRCLVTNNSNARITLDTTQGYIELPGPDLTVPFSGTIEAGAQAMYPLWSGSSSVAPTASCSGGVTLRSGVTTGGGTGGAVIPMSGTITADRVPASGGTVTITGDNVQPSLVPSYSVLLDGVPVPGSPVAATGPDFDFSIAVDIPDSLAPGTHVLTVVISFNDRDVALAAFPFEVAEPELAATGAELDGSSAAWSGLAGLLVLAAGAGLLLASRRRQTA